MLNFALTELMITIQQKSDNISKAVAKLQDLLRGIEERTKIWISYAHHKYPTSTGQVKQPRHILPLLIENGNT